MEEQEVLEMINQTLLKKVMQQSGIRKKDDALNFVMKRFVENGSSVTKTSLDDVDHRTATGKKTRGKKNADISEDVLARNISPKIKSMMERHSTPHDPRDDGMTDDEILIRELEADNR